MAPFDPSPAEMAFLERVASEFAVAVESFLARQEAVRERDRLRTLFDITNALVSKLSPDELFSAISDQLSKVIRHDYAVLTLRNDGDRPPRCVRAAFHRSAALRSSEGAFNPVGMPAAEVLATGKPVVATRHRYRPLSESPNFRQFVILDFKSDLLGSVDRTRSHDRNAGTQSQDRWMTWSPDDVEFLVQVANQIAIAVENSLSYRELAEMKERLATEKLYLEDEIRLDHNIGNMVGEGRCFPVRSEERSDRCAHRLRPFSFWVRPERERNSSPGPFTN